MWIRRLSQAPHRPITAKPTVLVVQALVARSCRPCAGPCRPQGPGLSTLVWTVEVVKLISCRHAMILLHRLEDVRFYLAEPAHGPHVASRAPVERDVFFVRDRFERGAPRPVAPVRMV